LRTFCVQVHTTLELSELQRAVNIDYVLILTPSLLRVISGKAQRHILALPACVCDVYYRPRYVLYEDGRHAVSRTKGSSERKGSSRILPPLLIHTLFLHTCMQLARVHETSDLGTHAGTLPAVYIPRSCTELPASSDQ
jgi:hypothetical protein